MAEDNITLNEASYTLPEEKGKMVAETSAAYCVTAREVQALRHDVMDAVYSSNDATKLRRCLAFLTQDHCQQEESGITHNQAMSSEEAEQLLRDTLVPALRDTKAAAQRGEHFSDARELLYDADIWKA